MSYIERIETGKNNKSTLKAILNEMLKKDKTLFDKKKVDADLKGLDTAEEKKYLYSFLKKIENNRNNRNDDDEPKQKKSKSKLPAKNKNLGGFTEEESDNYKKLIDEIRKFVKGEDLKVLTINTVFTHLVEKFGETASSNRKVIRKLIPKILQESSDTKSDDDDDVPLITLTKPIKVSTSSRKSRASLSRTTSSSSTKEKVDTSEYTPNEKKRFEELTELPKRSKSGETSIFDIARDYKIDGYTKMNKEPLIDAIIKSEKKGIPPRLSKTPKLKKASNKSKDMEVAVATPIKSSKMPSLSYDNLVNKRIEDLQEMLKDRKLEPTDDDDEDLDQEKISHLISQFDKNKQICNDDNDYKCGDGLICDIHTNPGVCVEPVALKKDRQWITYDDKNIVGNKYAINTLRKKLGIDKYTQPEEIPRKRQYLLNSATEKSKFEKKKFKHMTDDQLREYLKAWDDSSKHLSIEEDSDAEDVDIPKELEKLTKSIERTQISVEDVEVEDEEEEEIPDVISGMEIKENSVYEESEVEDGDSVEEKSPVKIKAKKTPAPEYDTDDINNLVSNVISGKADRIEDFSDIQRTVMKCLGLTS